MEASPPSGRTLLSDRIAPPVHTPVPPDSSGDSTLENTRATGQRRGTRLCDSITVPNPPVPGLTPPPPLAAGRSLPPGQS